MYARFVQTSRQEIVCHNHMYLAMLPAESLHLCVMMMQQLTQANCGVCRGFGSQDRGFGSQDRFDSRGGSPPALAPQRSMPHLYVSCALSCALLLNGVWLMHFLSPLSNKAVHSASLKCHTMQPLSQDVENVIYTASFPDLVTVVAWYDVPRMRNVQLWY